MNAFRHTCRFAACALAAFGFSGCSSPATEAPVELKPGLYSVKIGSFGQPDAQLCLAGSDTENVDRVIKKYYAFLEEGCPHKKDERVGNAVGGTINCEIDPTAGWTTTYTGSVAADSLTIDAKVVNYAPKIGSENEREETVIDSRLTATRVSDCA